MSPAAARGVEGVILATIVLFGLLSVVSFRSLLPLAALSTIALLVLQRDQPLFRDIFRSPVFWALSGLLFAGALSWFVTVDRSQTGPKVFQLAAIFFVGLLMIAAFRRGAEHVDPARLRRAGIGSLGLMLGGILAASFMAETLQGLGVPEKYFFSTDDIANRAIILFSIFIFIFSVIYSRALWLLVLLAVILLFFLAFRTNAPHIAPIAVMLGAGASLAALWRPRKAFAALSGLTILCLATFTWVFHAHGVAAHAVASEQADNRVGNRKLQILNIRGIVHRLEIWDSTTIRVAERPWLGWGLDASRRVPATRERYANVEGRTTISLHPHNAFLQVWLEMGVAGALAAIGVVVALTGAALRFMREAPAAAPAMLGAATAALVVFSVSFGAFQSWWLGALFIMWAFAQVFAQRGMDAERGAGLR